MIYTNIIAKPRSIFKAIGFSILGLLLTFYTLITSIDASSNITEFLFYWEFMNVEIDVQNNGDMLVTETQKYVFNQEYSNQRYRYIPLDKVDNITDIEILENNQVIPSQIGRKNNQLWIRWQHELNPPESHIFTIKYRVIGGLLVNSNTNQVYWKAIFSDRSSPIQNAKVTVRVPESLAGKIDFFTHYTDNINIPISSQKLDSKTVEFIAQEPILKGQELKVQVVFPHHILKLQKPKWQQSSKARNTNDNIILLIIPGILLFFFYCLSLTNSNQSSSRRSSNYRSNRSSSGYSGGAGGGGGGCGGCGGCGGGGGGGGG